MCTSLPTKSSSRRGRFKKKLVSQAELEQEAPLIEGLMNPLVDGFHRGELTAAELCSLYVIHVLAHRFPGTWPGAKRATPLCPNHHLHFPLDTLKDHWEPNIQKRLLGFKTLGDIFNHFSLQSTPLTVNRSLLMWSEGSYGLELMFRIPRPSEVLEQQKRGRRCVTIVLEKAKASQFILGERDALSFTMHDLIHADHFYHDNQCYEGQLGFYGLLDYCVSRGDFEELLQNTAFEAEFEYLIADMNAYPIHLMKCFKSALVHYHQDGNRFFSDWVGHLELSEDESLCLLNLNSVSYHDQNDDMILKLLNRFKFHETYTSRSNKE
jgi:hypothetical protein